MTPSSTTATDIATGPVANLARRMGWTDGQLYTVAIGLSVALVLLAFGIPGSLGGATRFAAADARPAPVAPPPTTSVAMPDTPSVAPGPSGPPARGAVPAGPSPVGASAPSAPPIGSPAAAAPGDPSESPPDEPCPTTEGAQPVVDALGESGVFPDDSTTLILARITGCSQTDPAVLLLGALAEFGSGLPDPGIDIPVLPVPFVEIPPAVVDEVQPFRDAIDPMCDAVGSASQVFFFGFGTWPGGVGPAVGTPIRQLLLACGQLRPA